MGDESDVSKPGPDPISRIDTDAPAGEPADVALDDALDDEDGSIVLPWWQHPINILTLVITAAVLAALIGWMVGDSSTELEHSEVDTGFLQDMREHHEQAVYMGFVYRSLADIDPGLNTVAGSIILGQDIDIGRMVQMLRMFGEPEANEGDTSMAWMGMPTERGEMPGMATEEDLERAGHAVRRRGRRVLRRADARPPPRRDPHGRVRGRQRRVRGVRAMAASMATQPSGRDRRDGARARQLTALPAAGRPDRSTDRSYTPIDAGRVEHVPPRPGRGARTHARLHVGVCR